MADPPSFSRVAIVGTGLIGTSFGLALESAFPGISLVAYDRPEVLGRIASRNGRWETTAEIAAAARNADLIYISLPVVAGIAALPKIAAVCGARALVTDASSTKATVCREARNCFAPWQFLGGHPIAGRQVSGLENARADLFRGSRYVLIGQEESAGPRALEFAALLRRIGAEPFWCDAGTHDRAVALVSHVPQLLSVAMARVIADRTDETGLPVSLAGPGLGDLLRLAGSPYNVWRDICLTNTGNIARSLDHVAEAIEFLRTHLRDRELEGEFGKANELYKSLRDLQ